MSELAIPAEGLQLIFPVDSLQIIHRDLNHLGSDLQDEGMKNWWMQAASIVIKDVDFTVK